MEALFAIAMLCAVNGGGAVRDLKGVDAYQLDCQKAYIQCYEASLASVPPPQQNDPSVWFGRLKDCVKNRAVK